MAQATTNDRESSVLFSLNELMALERQRVEEESTAHAAALAAEAERERAAEHSRKEREAERMRAAEEARRAEEFGARAEAARIEALRQAERDRVLIEVNQKARLAELAAVHDHERKLSILRRDRSAKRLQWAAALATCVLVSAIAGGAAAFRGYVSQTEAEKVALAQRTEDARQAGQQKTEELERRLARLNAEREEAARRKLEVVPSTPAPPPVATTRPGPVRPVPPPRVTLPPKKPDCDEFDPMCGLSG